MTGKQRYECSFIIHEASVSTAVGAGMAQISMVDAVLITSIQIGMIMALGKVFGVEISESFVETTVYTFVTENVGRTVARGLIGTILIFENIIKGSTAAVLTESLGWSVAHKYDI